MDTGSPARRKMPKRTIVANGSIVEIGRRKDERDAWSLCNRTFALIRITIEPVSQDVSDSTYEYYRIVCYHYLHVL